MLPTYHTVLFAEELAPHTPVGAPTSVETDDEDDELDFGELIFSDSRVRFGGISTVPTIGLP